MHHVVARIEAGKFPERYSLTGSTCLVSAESKFMITVKDLVIGIDTESQVMIYKAFVKGFVEFLVLDIGSPVVEDLTKALKLTVIV
jgi:hypothetical protein